MPRTPLWMLNIIAVATLVLALSAVPAQATRPFIITEDAVALAPGSARLEVGLQHANWAKGQRVYALLTEFSYSLYANLDLEIEVPYEVVGGGGLGFSDGLGDMTAKAKINFVKERAANPLTLSGLVGIKFPTSSAATGTTEVDVRLAALASKRFGPVAAHANLAYTFLGSDGSSDLNDIIGVSIAMAMKTPLKQVTGVSEIFWQESPTTGLKDRLEIMGGATRDISPKLKIDGAVRVGLTRGAPPNDGASDYSLTAGLTFLYP